MQMNKIFALTLLTVGAVFGEDCELSTFTGDTKIMEFIGQEACLGLLLIFTGSYTGRPSDATVCPCLKKNPELVVEVKPKLNCSIPDTDGVNGLELLNSYSCTEAPTSAPSTAGEDDSSSGSHVIPAFVLVALSAFALV